MRILPILLFLLLSCSVLAQKNGTEYIDSAVLQLPRLKDDTNKAKLLGAISKKYMYINTDTGIKYGELELSLYVKLDWKKGITSANNDLGANYQARSDYKRALEFFFAGLHANEDPKDKRLDGILFANIGAAYHCLGLNDKARDFNLKALEALKEADDERTMANVYANIAMAYNMDGNFRMALDYDFRSLRLYEANRDSNKIAILSVNIGNTYTSLREYSKALEYYFRSLSVGEKTRNKIVVANVANSIAGIYEEQGNYRDALKYYLRSLEVHKEIGKKAGIALATGNIGNLLGDHGDRMRAIQYEKKALKIAEETGDKEIIAIETQLLGKSFLGLYADTAKKPLIEAGLPLENYVPDGTIPSGRNARLRLAIEYIERALKTEQDIQHPEGMKSCYEQLAKAYQLAGNFKKATACLNNYVAINDSVFSNDKKAEVNRIGLEKEYDIERMKEQMQAETLKRDNELKLHKQHEYLLLSIGGIIVFLGISVVIVRTNRIQHKLHDKIQKITEKELTKSESNLRAVFDNTEILYLLLDIEYNVVSYNQRMTDVYKEVTGHLINVGDSLPRILLIDKESEVLGIYNSVIANKKSIVYETAYNVANRTKYFMAHVTPILVNGIVNGICISSFEITKMKGLEFEREKVIRDLKQKNSDLYEFSQIVSHNLRGPLATILGLADVIKSSYGDTELKFIIDGIITSSNSLDAVVKELNEILAVRNETTELKSGKTSEK